MHITPEIGWLLGITFGAAIVNGAIGYGFSSLTVPLALLFLTNRLLNPAIVLVEVALNLTVVGMNRKALGGALREMWPILLGLVPAVAVGSLWLRSANPAWVKVISYGLLLPFIVLQVAGIRRPLRTAKGLYAAVGGGVGLLYSLTTISGPPLALLLNNQERNPAEFKAQMGVVRVAESIFTLGAYAMLGLFNRQTVGLAESIGPSVLLGLLVGHLLVRLIAAETFRRLCMGFDLLVVAFGLTKVLTKLGLVDPLAALLIFLLLAAVDVALLGRFFLLRRRETSKTIAATPSP